MFRIKDMSYFKELGNARPLLSNLNNKSLRKDRRVQEGNYFTLSCKINVLFLEGERCRYLVERRKREKREERGRRKRRRRKERKGKLSMPIITN